VLSARGGSKVPSNGQGYPFKVIGDWGLRSSAVKLDGHFGHKVTVSGLIIHESKAGETNKGKTEMPPATRSPAICALRA
jgi:hypothetical protein